MKITNIKQILEITDFKEVNKKLEEGWVLLEIYQKDKCNLNYVLGNTEFESTKIKIGTGIYVDVFEDLKSIIIQRGRCAGKNSLNKKLEEIREHIEEEYGKQK